MSENKPENRPDPIQQTTVRIAGADNKALEHRLKLDMYNAVCKVKPEVGEGVSIEDDVYSGQFFETLKPALQGIAVSKLENSIFFYDKIGYGQNRSGKLLGKSETSGSKKALRLNRLNTAPISRTSGELPQTANRLRNKIHSSDSCRHRRKNSCQE